MSIYSGEHGYLEGPHRYRNHWYSLRRHKWYRWHLPDGESFLDVTPEVTRTEAQISDKDWASLSLLLARARQEDRDFVDLIKTKKFWAVVLGVYLIFWSGGRWSYNYTHNCLRSHKEDVYNPSIEDVETVTVCDFYGGNSKRWSLLDPVRAAIGWDF